MAETTQTEQTRTVDQIMDNYRSDEPGVRANLYRMLNFGRLAGTGKLVILPVDQGFEHGPARSFAANPGGYDPEYHVQLALDSGCNAYAAPYGSIQTIAHDFAGKIPLILKINNHDTLCDEADPAPAQTSSVQDALRLGCAAVGFTIYPGSSHWKSMYEQLRGLSEEARAHGLAVVVWSYPRGSTLSKEGETGMDVVAYAAQIAAQLGAHIIKVKLPTDHLEQDAAKKVYQAEQIPIATLADRVKHIMQSTFAGKRIVVFSGGGKKGEDSIFDEARAIRDGGGNGSIIGRNSFQRPRADAIKFLQKVMDIYAGRVV